MATQTTHYNLTKPGLTDLVDVTVLNDNADIIDDAIYEASQSGGAAMIESSVEATTTSAHAYAVGDHFIYNNTLYAVTAAIAVGDTIAPGTNCAATTVMDEVEAGGGGTSDYTQLSNKPQINGNTLTGNQTGAQLGLVDAVSGKGLSSNDYTTAEKEKLEGIAAGAEANVQSDWNQADSTADDYIKNRTHYAVPAWTQKISADLHPISGESMRKLCGQGTAGVQTLTNGKLYTVTLGSKVWTGYPIKYTWTAHEYAYFLETDIGLTLEDEHDDNPSWAGWKAYITTGSTVDWYAHLTIEENSGENVTKLDNKYLDMDSAPASGSAKPVTSGGVYTALTGKISTTAKGAANGVASLDATGKIPSTQMPDTQLNSTQAADAYDPTATYAVGDKVSYAGNVYSCISAISTPEAWDSTHWDQVDPIQDQVDDVRNTLNSKANMFDLGLIRTGPTNTSNKIASGLYFYLDGILKRAIADIENGATFTSSNCESVTAGGLNSLYTLYTEKGKWEAILGSTTATGSYNLTNAYNNYKTIVVMLFCGGATLFSSSFPTNMLITSGYVASVIGKSGDTVEVSFPTITTAEVSTLTGQSVRIYGVI